MSDFWPHGKITETYGVLRPQEGRSERAIFVIDKQGILRYIDIHDIDLQPDNEELRDVLRKIDPEAAAREVVRPESPLPTGGIVMYCTKWCADCNTARQWFQAHKLAYTEVDIYSVEGALKQCHGMERRRFGHADVRHRRDDPGRLRRSEIGRDPARQAVGFKFQRSTCSHIF